MYSIQGGSFNYNLFNKELNVSNLSHKNLFKLRGEVNLIIQNNKKRKFKRDAGVALGFAKEILLQIDKKIKQDRDNLFFLLLNKKISFKEAARNFPHFIDDSSFICSLIHYSHKSNSSLLCSIIDTGLGKFESKDRVSIIVRFCDEAPNFLDLLARDAIKENYKEDFMEAINQTSRLSEHLIDAIETIFDEDQERVAKEKLYEKFGKYKVLKLELNLEIDCLDEWDDLADLEKIHQKGAKVTINEICKFYEIDRADSIFDFICKYGVERFDKDKIQSELQFFIDNTKIYDQAKRHYLRSIHARGASCTWSEIQHLISRKETIFMLELLAKYPVEEEDFTRDIKLIGFINSVTKKQIIKNYNYLQVVCKKLAKCHPSVFESNFQLVDSKRRYYVYSFVDFLFKSTLDFVKTKEEFEAIKEFATIFDVLDPFKELIKTKEKDF